MAKDRLQDFELFYQEIPASQDYLQEAEIEDCVDEEKSDRGGLDANQVSMLAQDALASNVEAKKKVQQSNSDDETPQLF